MSPCTMVRGLAPHVSGSLKSADKEVPPDLWLKGLGLRLPINTVRPLLQGRALKAIGWLMPSVT